ncbi:glycogen synthase [Streptococcus pneumoniae]|nr:glycogen synthase [Streptococcus pneumoniae]
MIPFLLKEKYRWIQAYEDIETVLTIHNLEFQGVLEYVQDIQPYREIDTDYFRGLE